MKANVKVNWEEKAKKALNEAPENILYSVARITLDTTYSHIPLSNLKNAGKLRQSSMGAGVRGGNKDYYVGSYTDYAKRVWNMGSNTNWTTPNTFGKWYEKVYNQYKNKIMTTAIERNKIK